MTDPDAIWNGLQELERRLATEADPLSPENTSSALRTLAQAVIALRAELSGVRALARQKN